MRVRARGRLRLEGKLDAARWLLEGLDLLGVGLGSGVWGSGQGVRARGFGFGIELGLGL